MTSIAIVGSRDFPDLDRVRRFVRSLKSDVIVVSGGAGGVDTTAELEARALGLAVEVYTPDWAHYGKAAGAIRNRKIVERADRIVAFWNGSPGTLITIQMALKVSKIPTVFTSNRQLNVEEIERAANKKPRTQAV